RPRARPRTASRSRRSASCRPRSSSSPPARASASARSARTATPPRSHRSSPSSLDSGVQSGRPSPPSRVGGTTAVVILGEEYDRRDALGLAELVRAKEVDPSELLEEAIARAERVNPRLNAIVTPMYDLAGRRAKGAIDGPFAGVPFLLKDLLAHYEGVRSCAGSRIYRGFVPAHHAELVRRHEAAGLVVFGRTSTSELGILPTSEAEVYGPTHNPWRHGVSAGGSSGGAAAAVAAGIVPMAHGSDGGGSIRIPASCCGVFGLKPSRMRLPVGPDESEHFFGFAVEHALSRPVRASAALLDARAGPVPTSTYFTPHCEGFLAELDRSPEKLRIAFTREPLLPAEPHVDATRADEEAAALCEELGNVVEPARPQLDGHAF